MIPFIDIVRNVGDGYWSNQRNLGDGYWEGILSGYSWGVCNILVLDLHSG